jgi:hypothetical protein
MKRTANSSGLKSMYENPFWVGTVGRVCKIQPRRGETLLAQGVSFCVGTRFALRQWTITGEN